MFPVSSLLLPFPIPPELSSPLLAKVLQLLVPSGHVLVQPLPLLCLNGILNIPKLDVDFEFNELLRKFGMELLRVDEVSKPMSEIPTVGYGPAERSGVFEN